MPISFSDQQESEKIRIAVATAISQAVNLKDPKRASALRVLSRLRGVLHFSLTGHSLQIHEFCGNKRTCTNRAREILAENGIESLGGLLRTPTADVERVFKGAKLPLPIGLLILSSVYPR